MRSDEAIAACMMLYFSDRSRIGWKNWFEQLPERHERSEAERVLLDPVRTDDEQRRESSPRA